MNMTRNQEQRQSYIIVVCSKLFVNAWRLNSQVMAISTFWAQVRVCYCLLMVASFHL